MSAPDGGYRMAPPLNDGEVFLCAVEVVGYINSEGENCYSTRFDSSVPTSTILGLLELAKAQVLAESDFP